VTALADNMANWMGGPRHAPQADFSDAKTFGEMNDVNDWNQRRPASDSDVQGTGDMLSGVHKPGKKSPGGMASVSGTQSPLDLGAHEDIIAASGLGRRAPAQKTKGEQMSDADEPTQAVKSLPDGTFVHRRRNPATGNVNRIKVGPSRNPLDDYEHLNYDPMPANIGELQERLGTPPEMQAQIGGAVAPRLSGMPASQIPNYFAGG
jgi:hypothetical protein